MEERLTELIQKKFLTRKEMFEIYLTEGQIKRLYAIGYKKGYSKDYMAKLVNAKYKKSIEDLSKEEYDYICNTLGE